MKSSGALGRQRGAVRQVVVNVAATQLSSGMRASDPDAKINRSD